MGLSGAQRGSLIGGIWLIALGSVFFVQQAMGLPWSEAWPLFLVMAGIGSGASVVVGLLGRRLAPWSLVAALLWPLILIGVGLLLFLDLAEIVELDAFGLLADWWPLLLIGVGILFLVGAVWPRGRGVSDTVSVATGGVTEGEVVLKFGAGQLDVGRGRPGILVEGEFEGGVIRRDPGPGRVELESDVTQIIPWFGQQQRWRVGLAPDLPLRLRLEGGASRTVLELGDLAVRELVLKIGAADTRVALPREVERCDVRIDAGAASVSVQVPDGVAARIRSQMGLGSTNVAETRFPRSADGWESVDYATAPRRVEIRVQGGLGSVRIG